MKKRIIPEVEYNLAVQKATPRRQCNRCQNWFPKEQLRTTHSGFGIIPTDPENHRKEFALRQMCEKYSGRRFKLFPFICLECIESDEVQKILYPDLVKENVSS